MTSVLEPERSERAGCNHAEHSNVHADRQDLPTGEHRLIGMVGLGYVGLPTALALLETGVSVVGCDVSEARLADIKTERVDLLDRDRQRLRRHLRSDRLTLTTESRALGAADAVIVCVPTPVDAHQVPDLSALRGACDMVVAQAGPGQTIIITSTTFVGCTRTFVVERLEERGLRVGVDVFVAFSPERIDPGNPAHVPELTPRVVGGVSPECTRRAAEVLRRVSSQVHEVSSPEAGEFTKLLENTFRAVNIALANEFSLVARELGVDPIEAIHAAATKPYGFMAFYPGPGVGGHCIPCDPHYLLWQLKAHHQASPVTEAAMASIGARPRMVTVRAQGLLAEYGKPLAGARVLVMGVTYKPGVADLRESPALEIIEQLHRAGARVSFADPLVPALWTRSGEFHAEPDPGDQTWDLVIAHTLQPGYNDSWLSAVPLVLDTTYQLKNLPQCHVL